MEQFHPGLRARLGNIQARSLSKTIAGVWHILPSSFHPMAKSPKMLRLLRLEKKLVFE